jgi:hypothetical protein
MDCPDLKELFAEEYCIRLEDGAVARNDPWYFLIPCRLGHIAPWGPDTLVACTNSRGPTRNGLLQVPTANLVQDGDDGANITFDVRHMGLVADIMGAKRRVHLSPEQRAKQVERLRSFRFRPQERGTQIDQTGPSDVPDESKLTPGSRTTS